MNKSKGFTIIELLVVVAIIAVLAAIVLVNVTQYIGKGKNSAIKGNMATLLTNGAVYYDANGNFTSFKTDTSTGCGGPIATAITGAGGSLTCQSGAAAWCGCSTMNVTTSDPSGSTFCVDSTGVKKETTTTCANECSSTVFTCQ